jgi:uncharacterized protein (DUF2132 family)
MNFVDLHAKYKDENSPSVEGQIRWLQKQGFAQHQIEQAMIKVYMEIERDEKDFANGMALDQHLLQVAKLIRTDELTQQIRKMEDFVEELKKKWQAEEKKKNSWFRRLFK